jgi:hypothetical protein
LAAALFTWSASESMMVDETGTGTKGGRALVLPVVHMTRNGMTTLGLLGGTMGLSLGLAGGLLKRSARSAALAGLAGTIFGAAAAAGAARVLVPIYFQHSGCIDLMFPLLIHSGLWLAVAIPAGLAFGLGVGDARRAIEAIVYAVVGAILATVIYEVAGVWLFPRAQTDRPLPISSAARLFAYIVVALGISSALVFAVARPVAPSSDSPATPS